MTIDQYLSTNIFFETIRQLWPGSVLAVSEQPPVHFFLAKAKLPWERGSGILAPLRSIPGSACESVPGKPRFCRQCYPAHFLSRAARLAVSPHRTDQRELYRDRFQAGV